MDKVFWTSSWLLQQLLPFQFIFEGLNLLVIESMLCSLFEFWWVCITSLVPACSSFIKVLKFNNKITPDISLWSIHVSVLNYLTLKFTLPFNAASWDCSTQVLSGTALKINVNKWYHFLPFLIYPKSLLILIDISYDNISSILYIFFPSFFE